MVYLISNQKEAFETEAYERATISDLVDYCSKHEWIGVDTETGGFDPYTCDLKMIQIGDRIDQYVIDLSTVPIAPLKPILENKKLILQNAKFDLRFFYHQGIVPQHVFDTFLAERILSTGINIHGKSLQALVHRYVSEHITLDKAVRTKIELNTRSILYAADDVKYLHDIKAAQEKALYREGLQFTMILDNDFVRVLAYLEYCGIYLDKLQWKRKAQEDLHSKEERKALCDRWLVENLPKSKWVNSFGDLFNPEPYAVINWGSPKQCVELFKSLGVSVTVWEKGKKKESADAKVLKPQSGDCDLIPLYLDYKEAEKLCSTYGMSFLKQVNPVTQRIHTQFTQIMNTGRMSSGGKDKALGIQLVNMQNIPADHRTRSCFKAELGNILVDADYSGQEQIVLANFSKEPNILEFYRKKLGDMHSFVASKIYPELADTPLHEIKEKHKDKRQVAKAAGFAINYGGNGQTIADNLSISVEQGEKVYQAYFKAFPKLKNYFLKCQKKALDRGYIYFNNVTGRKSYIEFYKQFEELQEEVDNPMFWDYYRQNKDSIPGLKDKVRTYFNYKGVIERRALNYPIQGTSADITKIAAIYFMKWLEDNNYLFTVRICNMIHDEILVECPVDMADEVAENLKECMERAGTFFCPEIPLEADPCISENWEH